jgi:hypothetical protein
VNDRYARYETLRELAIAANHAGAWDLGEALRELARLVLHSRDRAAARALRQVNDEAERVTRPIRS